MMTITELREKTGLSRPGFASEFHIPVRTIENWEAYEKGSKTTIARKPPEYVCYLLEQIICKEL